MSDEQDYPENVSLFAPYQVTANINYNEESEDVYEELAALVEIARSRLIAECDDIPSE